MRSLVLTMVLALAVQASGDVIFSSTFTNTSASAAANGWFAYNGPGATNSSSLSANGDNTGVWSSQGSDTTGSYIFVGNDFGDQDNLLYTDNVGAENLDVSNVDSIEYSHRYDSSAVGEHIAIQVAGTWYRSTNTFSGSGIWEDVSYTFSTAASDWYLLNFTPGSQLDYSNTTNPGSDLSGNLDAVGVAVLASPTASDTSRYDEFRVNGTTAIPEPGSVILIGVGVFALRIVRRLMQSRAA